MLTISFIMYRNRQNCPHPQRSR